MGFEIVIFESFYEFIKENSSFDPEPNSLFKSSLKKDNKLDLMFSIGGDGTFLECVSYVRDCDIPIVGINSGRLGFLANISKEDLPSALKSIFNKFYTIEERTLLEVQTSSGEQFKDFSYALNEVTVQKRDSGSMITIHVYMNDLFLNSYWADGLIISTPTGSTAYSLSVGGPIIVPGSQNFVITPIAPHNLTVRPLVVPDNNELTLKIESRAENYLASLDYHTEIIDTSVILTVKAADYKVKILKLDNISFFSTLRAKLMWGLDKRN